MYFWKNKNAYVWGMLLLMMVLNSWLLYEKYSFTDKLNTLQALQIHHFGQKALVDKPLKFKGTWKISNPIMLVAIFTDYGCTSCVVAEIEYLNKWVTQFPNSVKIYYSGNEKKYLEKYGASFSYLQIAKPEKLFDKALIFGNPILAVIDSQGTALMLNTNDTSRPGSAQRRMLFHYKVNSIFDSIY